MSLPIVTESSEISRLAERKFSSALPGTWITSSPKQGDDYGIDVTVEITSGAHPSGRLAHIQLKGTRAERAKARTLHIKESTLSFLRAHADIGAIVRVQVDEDRFWLIHIYDARTRAVPDAAGYVTIRLEDEDEVAAQDLPELIDRLSYRKWIQASRESPFVIQVSPPELAMRLNAWFAARIPSAISFVPEGRCADPAHQMLMEFASPSQDAPVELRDLATPHRSTISQRSPGHLLLGLADLLARTGVPQLASGIVMRSVDLITQQAIDTLERTVQQRLLIDACVDHATDNEIAQFVEVSLATHAHWAGEWAVNFVTHQRFVASTQCIDAIFSCIGSSGHLSKILLRSKLYLWCRHFDAAREHVKSLQVQPDADPVDLFELGDLADIFGCHEKARYAWRQAARRGYDRLACKLEIARSFVAEGRISEAMRNTPRKGTPKDDRCRALFALLDFLRSVLKKLPFKDDDVDTFFGTSAGVRKLIESLPRDEEAKPTVALLVSAVAVILALRAHGEPSASAWANALEWAMRARLPAEQIDAIVDLSAPMYGGEPLRIAAVALDTHPGARILAKYHKLLDAKKSFAYSRQREDFVTRRA